MLFSGAMSGEHTNGRGPGHLLNGARTSPRWSTRNIAGSAVTR